MTERDRILAGMTLPEIEQYAALGGALAPAIRARLASGRPDAVGWHVPPKNPAAAAARPRPRPAAEEGQPSSWRDEGPPLVGVGKGGRVHRYRSAAAAARMLKVAPALVLAAARAGAVLRRLRWQFARDPGRSDAA